MEIEFLSKDQNHQDETTNYWFNVNGEDWAISDCNGEISLLDCDGGKVEECNDHGNIKDLLTPEYEKRIMD